MASTYKQVQDDSIAQLKSGLKNLIIWGAISFGIALIREFLVRQENSSASQAPDTAPPEIKAKTKRPNPEDEVDYASDQSFPASDPPSWTQHH